MGSGVASELPLVSEERPTKRVRLLDESDSDEISNELKINEEYARRFEHNHRRAELHRLEAKFGPSSSQKANLGDNEEGDEESSSSEEEDEDGILASGKLDEEFNATLKAIRSKDPRVYDKNTTFYTVDEGTDVSDDEEGPRSKDKTLKLKDYHRENLLRDPAEIDEKPIPRSYVQEQDDLKKALLNEVHSKNESGNGRVSDDGNDTAEDDADFLVRKPKAEGNREELLQSRMTLEDVEAADKDPEAFLSKFLESRAWVAPSGSAMHPFESDDEDAADEADEFEQAYNLRFENNPAVNEKIVSHARDAAARYSVRHEPINKRKRAREAERDQKEELKRQNAEEKSRWRKLRLEEAQAKLQKIKEAAGMGNRSLDIDEWQGFLTEDWDGEKWEEEMRQRFDEDYYKGDDGLSDQEGSTKRKLKKPKWENDIDITDLVPDFKDDENPSFSPSGDERNGDADAPPKKSKKKERNDEKREARIERRKLEQLVDEQLDVDMALDGKGKNGSTPSFRYRQTSPLSYGMTAKDILLASDSQLNQYAGIKKLASFREADKKRKDKKKLGKKARLRQWRKETFGDESGPQKTLQDFIKEAQAAQGATLEDEKRRADIREEKNGKKRRKTKH